MAFNMWRGTVGLIKPTFRPGSTEDLIRMLPDGIGVIPLHLNIRQGTREEFAQAIPHYEQKVAELVEIGVDLVHPAGAPPFLLLGYKGEQELLNGWEARYRTPVFTNGTSQVNAFHALKVKRFIGFSYFPGEINTSFGRYFQEAGFDVLEMRGLEVAFDKVETVSSTEIYRWIREVFARHRNAQAIYMLGPAWRTLDILALMECDFGIPVVHHIPAQSWEIQRRLLVRHPFQGFGRLIGEMPELPA
jgi:maleate cis-trans isomerase